MLRLFNCASRLASSAQPLLQPLESCKVFHAGICSSVPNKRPEEAVAQTPSFIKTSETNPLNLNSTHLGRFYSISEDIYQKLYIPHHGFPLEFREQCKTFREQCVMVRKPYLELKRCVDAIDLQKPIVRFLIHGPDGSGKSMTLGSMVHYGHTRGFILVHFPWIPLWTRWVKELIPSPNRPEFFDHTVDAVAWLMHFRSQNSDLIQTQNLITSHEYNWSKRETTPAGSSLLDIVEHGISRPGHASECILKLLKELKEQSSQHKCKTMVLADGVNDLFYECDWLTKEKEVSRRQRYWHKRTVIPTSQVTMYGVMKDIFKTDWTGGVAIATVDRLAINVGFRESNLPRYLLKKEGWELFDPFVPIEVKYYSSQEIQTTIDYYLERKWLTHPAAKTEEGRLELEYLSTRNPRTLMAICNSR